MTRGEQRAHIAKFIKQLKAMERSMSKMYNSDGDEDIRYNISLASRRAEKLSEQMEFIVCDIGYFYKDDMPIGDVK